MKFIACADLHFTDKIPRNRKDDYFAAQLMKFGQILEKAEYDEADLLIAGDVFDSVKTPYKITKAIMEVISNYGVNIYTTFGQHDLVYHSKGLNNTPLGILSTMDQVTILNNKTKISITDGIEESTLIGAGWNQVPKEEADILITHQMVVHKNPLWPGQEEYSTATQIMKKYPWANFIISGDNHLPFIVEKKEYGRFLINCGSIMRKGKDQINHEPVIWLINTQTREVENIKLKVQPYKKVFDLSKIKREEIQEEIKNQTKEDIDQFVKSLEMSGNKKPNFKNVLKKVIQEMNPDNEVKEIINNLMEEIA